MGPEDIGLLLTMPYNVYLTLMYCQNQGIRYSGERTHFLKSFLLSHLFHKQLCPEGILELYKRLNFKEFGCQGMRKKIHACVPIKFIYENKLQSTGISLSI